MSRSFPWLLFTSSSFGFLSSFWFGVFFLLFLVLGCFFLLADLRLTKSCDCTFVPCPFAVLVFPFALISYCLLIFPSPSHCSLALAFLALANVHLLAVLLLVMLSLLSVVVLFSLLLMLLSCLVVVLFQSLLLS